jgi:hypothetical protein
MALFGEEEDLICEARDSSFEAVRETRIRLKPFFASWRAYSLPMPSEAPVMTAQEPLGPKEESCRDLKSVTCPRETEALVT